MFIKKKRIFVIFCKFKKRNPRAIGKNRQILDRNVLVIGGPFDISSEEKASLVETMCLEPPESMIKLGELDVPATRAWTLSLSSELDPPSLLFELSGREIPFFSRIWVSISIYFFIQELSVWFPLLQYAHLFISPLFFSSGSSSWNLMAPPKTVSCLSFAQVDF